MAVDDLQSSVDSHKTKILIEKREANGRCGDELQLLRFLSFQLSDSIAQTVLCSFVASIHRRILLDLCARTVSTPTSVRSAPHPAHDVAQSTRKIESGKRAVINLRTRG